MLFVLFLANLSVLASAGRILIAKNGESVAEATADGGTCCCKPGKSKEWCEARFGRGYATEKHLRNWQVMAHPLQEPPFQHEGSDCCVLFAADKCEEIPNVSSMSMFKLKHKEGWKPGKCNKIKLPAVEEKKSFNVQVAWIRHGFACHNVRSKIYSKRGGMKIVGGCWFNDKDPPLSDCGVAQSISAGESFKKIEETRSNQGKGNFLDEVDFVGSSEQMRAMETAHYMFPSHKVTPVPFIKESGSSNCNTPEAIAAQKGVLQEKNPGDLAQWTDYSEADAWSSSRGTQDLAQFLNYMAGRVLPKAHDAASTKPIDMKLILVSHSHFMQDHFLKKLGSLNNATGKKLCEDGAVANNGGFIIKYRFERKPSGVWQFEEQGCDRHRLSTVQSPLPREVDAQKVKGKWKPDPKWKSDGTGRKYVQNLCPYDYDRCRNRLNMNMVDDVVPASDSIECMNDKGTKTNSAGSAVHSKFCAMTP